MVTKRKRTVESKKKPGDTGKVARVEEPARRVAPKKVEAADDRSAKEQAPKTPSAKKPAGKDAAAKTPTPRKPKRVKGKPSVKAAGKPVAKPAAKSVSAPKAAPVSKAAPTSAPTSDPAASSSTPASAHDARTAVPASKEAGRPAQASASQSVPKSAPKPVYKSGAQAYAQPGAKLSNEGDPADASDRIGSQRKKAKTTKSFKLRWPAVAALSVLAVLVLIVGVFSWDRWLRYNDAAEFQGEWRTPGSTAVVVIDGQTIKLTPDVSYAYTLDTGAKTISFTFGNMQGEGRYRFSLDRSQLVITDGKEYTWFSTLIDDIGWMFDQALRSLQDQPAESPTPDENVTVLDRLSGDASASPREGAPVASGEDSAASQDADANGGEGASGDANAGAAEGAASADGTGAAEGAPSVEGANSTGTSSPVDPETAAPSQLFDVRDV